MYKGHRVSAIVTCAGRGTRFGSNKLLVKLKGRTVLETTVAAMDDELIDELIVTVSPDNEDTYRRILEAAGITATYVIGGEERHVSAQRALSHASGDIVVVHDGVRPFVTAKLIKKVIRGAAQHGAAMLGTPSTVQVKLIDDERFVQDSLDRAHSWLGQTPQAFRRELLELSYEKAEETGYTRVSDDADLVAEFAGVPARIYLGDPTNIKITTPQDLGAAKLIAKERAKREKQSAHTKVSTGV